jgi:putative hemolysin
MELLLLPLLFVLNGFFSMSEMAVVSARKARLQQLHDEGHAAAGAALELANQPSHFLSTIQVGITVIGITSGVLGEATLSARVAEWLAQWPALASNAQGIATAIVIAGITVASLLIGELIPKRLALVNPEAVASLVAKPMRWLSAFVYPIVRVLTWVTDAVLRLLGSRATASPPVTEEEIRVLMEQGARAGVFGPHEHQIVSRVFRMDDLTTAAIMTPRTDIVSLDMEASREANVARIAEAPHALFPVVRGDIDHLEGIVAAKELLVDLARDAPFDLARHLRRPLYIPETLTVTEVLRAFRQHRVTMALIVNEYGELQGLVTLHNVFEALVGDIGPTDSEADPDIVTRADGSLLVDGAVTIDRLKHVLEIEDDELPGEDSGSYNTLAGFVMLQLGRVPRTGDRFDWGGFDFEVVDMDKNRVDRLLISRRTPGGPASRA